MSLDDDPLASLIANPSESLAVELKAWVDPTTPQGIKALVRAVLALRNSNGGFLLIGFDNQTRQPLRDDAPMDPSLVFHADLLQGLVSKYAFEKFEVTVHYPSREGTVFPVIEVPSGVQTPVAARSDLVEGSNFLIRAHTVYVRTLNSNGTVSSSSARAADWSRIVSICVDNREANIVAFAQRYLSRIDRGTAGALARSFAAVAEGVDEPEGSVARMGLDRGRAAMERTEKK